MERLPADVSATVVSFLGMGLQILILRLVNRQWRAMIEGLKPQLMLETDKQRDSVEEKKQWVAEAKGKCVEVFEMQMRGLFLCQSQIGAFRSQDISSLSREAAVSLCGLFLILENQPSLPQKSQLEYLARYTKCPLFTSRLSEISPSDLRPETFTTLKMIVEDADFLRVRDGLPGLPNAIANWVSMFYSYALTTVTIRKLNADTKRLDVWVRELDQFQCWLES